MWKQIQRKESTFIKYLSILFTAPEVSSDDDEDEDEESLDSQPNAPLLQHTNRKQVFGSVHTVRFVTAIYFCSQWTAWELVMSSQSHNVNTSIESCVTHLLRLKESQSQSEKKHTVRTGKSIG